MISEDSLVLDMRCRVELGFRTLLVWHFGLIAF